MKRVVWAASLALVVVLGFGIAIDSEFQQLGMEPTGVFEETVESGPVRLVAVGDVMLARKVQGLAAAYGDDYPFARLGRELQQADIAFGNLESPLSYQGQALPGKGICFRARPSMASQLVRQGFDVLSIANNHALDYDVPAFLDTGRFLREAGIQPVGGGRNIEEARRMTVLERNGLRVGFLAYTEMADIYFDPGYRSFRATGELAGVAPLVEKEVSDDIKAARNQVGTLVVSLHWGTEYSSRPTAEQRRMAHRFIDDGADIILGHHPHVLQGVERYKGGLIAYSLGNFVFDQNQRTDTRQGLMLRVTLPGAGVGDAEILPVFIKASQPALVTGEQARAIVTRVCGLSRELGTNLIVNGDKAVSSRVFEEGSEPYHTSS